MQLCQYEFQFQNEYMADLERNIGNVLGIARDQENIIRKDIENQSFILIKKDSKNFMLFCGNQISYVYLLIVRCEKKYEEPLREILLKLCDEIEEDYGENHRKEVRNVFLEQDNNLAQLEEKYKITDLFNKLVR